MLQGVSARCIEFGVLDQIAKRSVDILISLALLLLLSPVFMVIGLLIASSSPGPMVYRQKRVGLDGKLFEIFKFRTMYCNADQRGPSVTSSDDCRITPVGRRLRAWKLDELPQFLNVLRGDMSLVGPRPQVPQYVQHFDPDLRDLVLGVRPGITGPTALWFRCEERILANRPDREDFYIRQVIPVKLLMDAEYVESRSFWEDMKILKETAILMTPARGMSIYSKPDPRMQFEQPLELLR
jgi:lipopolysaccharide/colanic/teichoic acid biosynthesis glycosyltransferase